MAQHYLRAIPRDPYTNSADSWISTPALDDEPGLYDVRSAAEGNAQDGTPLSEL